MGQHNMKSNAAEYTHLLQQLLPPGAAWPRESAATLTKLLTGFADGLARAHNRGIDLLDETDPRVVNEMLADWERAYGLPTACLAGIDQTAVERRLTLHAHVTSRGGQSRAFFISMAAVLGYEITISEFRPFTCESTCEDPICDELWRFVWTVNAPENTILEFTCDSGCNDPLRTWGNERLECEINRRKPAHTLCHFAYQGVA